MALTDSELARVIDEINTRLSPVITRIDDLEAAQKTVKITAGEKSGVDSESKREKQIDIKKLIDQRIQQKIKKIK